MFFDELTEFSRTSLEVLRQPLESHRICISRTNAVYEFPADFLFVAAMNPCGCGYYPDRNRCSCTQEQVRRYLQRLSGPLLDRFDLCAQVNDVPGESIQNQKRGKNSREIREEIRKVHEIQRERYRGTDICFNASLGIKTTEKYCKANREGEKLLQKAYEKMNLSMRAYHKILKTARTIADLADSECIEEAHISEAILYRALDKNFGR